MVKLEKVFIDEKKEIEAQYVKVIDGINLGASIALGFFFVSIILGFFFGILFAFLGFF